MICETIDAFNKVKKKKPSSVAMCIAMGMNELTYNISKQFKQERLKLKVKKLRDGKDS